MGSKVKNFLKTVLKFVVSGGALYIVFVNIDWSQSKDAFLNANIGWLAAATFFFIVSKIIASIRLNLYFKDIGLNLSEKYNLRLYWIGMFYNMFLPGGIGGDGYKVYLLKKHTDLKVKPLVQATLLDRISGMVALMILGGIGYLFVDQEGLPSMLNYIDWAALVIAVPVFYVVVKKFFPPFTGSFKGSTIYSFATQVCQIITAYFILIALGVDALFPEYIVLFLISSIVAVFPFTIGGIGARELTFIVGYDYLGIDQNIAVTFSLLFFLITVVTSVVGGFLKSQTDKIGYEKESDQSTSSTSNTSIISP